MRGLMMGGAIALLLVVGLGGSAEAQRGSNGKWCQLDKGWSAVNCSFKSFAQCQATVSGVGGVCQRNPNRRRR